MAVAIVCAAAMTQAASIMWNSNTYRLTDAAGNNITSLSKGSLALVVMTSATDWKNAVDVSGLTGVSEDAISISTKASTKGQVSGALGFTYDSTGKLVNGNYLALMFKDSAGLHQLMYTSGDDAGEEVGAVWQISGISKDSDSVSDAKIGMTGNFTAESVPEPTSAMLLLLGMAGLALKRKRA